MQHVSILVHHRMGKAGWLWQTCRDSNLMNFISISFSFFRRSALPFLHWSTLPIQIWTTVTCPRPVAVVTDPGDRQRTESIQYTTIHGQLILKFLLIGPIYVGVSPGFLHVLASQMDLLHTMQNTTTCSSGVQLSFQMQKPVTDKYRVERTWCLCFLLLITTQWQSFTQRKNT